MPQGSQPRQLTVVVPIGKKLPLGGLQVTVTGPQPPVPVLTQVTTAPLVQVAAVTVILLEQVTVTRLLLLASPIVPGAVTEGDQVAPPSRLSSVKMSKKLSIR